jgi:hypothetical protein
VLEAGKTVAILDQLPPLFVEIQTVIVFSTALVPP